MLTICGNLGDVIEMIATCKLKSWFLRIKKSLVSLAQITLIPAQMDLNVKILFVKIKTDIFLQKATGFAESAQTTLRLPT